MFHTSKSNMLNFAIAGHQHPENLSLICFTSNKHYGDPSNALLMASESCFATSCQHDPLAPLEVPDDHAFYSISTMEPTRSEGRNPINVVAAHGNDDMRFMALAQGMSARGLIRQSACLQCCLDICRREDLDFVLC